jgi:hypothetical protein
MYFITKNLWIGHLNPGRFLFMPKLALARDSVSRYVHVRWGRWFISFHKKVAL